MGSCGAGSPLSSSPFGATLKVRAGVVHFVTAAGCSCEAGQHGRRCWHAALAELDIEIVPFDAELALAAALLQPATASAGLSLGDRACLALAAKLDATAMTADRAWLKVAGVIGVEIVLIR